MFGASCVRVIHVDVGLSKSSPLLSLPSSSSLPSRYPQVALQTNSSALKPTQLPSETKPYVHPHTPPPPRFLLVLPTRLLFPCSGPMNQVPVELVEIVHAKAGSSSTAINRADDSRLDDTPQSQTRPWDAQSSVTGAEDPQSGIAELPPVDKAHPTSLSFFTHSMLIECWCTGISSMAVLLLCPRTRDPHLGVELLVWRVPRSVDSTSPLLDSSYCPRRLLPQARTVQPGSRHADFGYWNELDGDSVHGEHIDYRTYV